MPTFQRKTLHKLFYALFILVGCFAVLLVYLEQDLPNVESLKNTQLQVPLRIYTADHRLLAEFGEKRRIPIELKDTPPLLINALIATEDKRFWEHGGIDILGLGRAAIQLAITGEKTQGGSTITMQVARNFFLSSKKSYIRKLREILLALKIDHELTKEQILYLYINKVYLGHRAYGFGAASMIYFGKPLKELNLSEIAVLAGLPKAPSTINPITNPERAEDRRNHVLLNMYEQNYISKAQYDTALKTKLRAEYHAAPLWIDAPYAAEMVRDAMVQQYGDDAYTKGLIVTTTLDSRLQLAANKALRTALLAYTQRHGYRGPIKNIGTPDSADSAVDEIRDLPIVNGLAPAVIMSVDTDSATAILYNRQNVSLPWTGLVWAGKALGKGWKGPAPKTASEILKVGDVVYLNQTNSGWELSQIPEVQGGLVSLNPMTGAINAVVGGFSFGQSKFNRVTDAMRQPGSGFKPFIYSAALAKGFTLASVINNAPIVTSDSSDEAGIWRPQNDDLRFSGPTRLREALAKSYNLVSIRLLQAVGVPFTVDYIKKMGFDPQALPENLTLALGTGDITPMQMAIGYATFANGGYSIKPYFIQSVVSSEEDNKVLFQAQPQIACATCDDSSIDNNNNNAANNQGGPSYAPRVISAQNAYLIASALQTVIQEGTGKSAKVLGRSDLSGKTGTTNDLKDNWFSGFNRDVLAICWVGFDQPRSTYEHGAQAALPMWIDFMRQTLAGQPEHAVPRPAGIVNMKIDPNTGLRARPGQANAMFEIFMEGSAPTQIAPPSAGGSQNALATESTPNQSTGTQQNGQPLY